jgi:hypothetical protein
LVKTVSTLLNEYCHRVLERVLHHTAIRPTSFQLSKDAIQFISGAIDGTKNLKVKDYLITDAIQNNDTFFSTKRSVPTDVTGMIADFVSPPMPS